MSYDGKIIIRFLFKVKEEREKGEEMIMMLISLEVGVCPTQTKLASLSIPFSHCLRLFGFALLVDVSHLHQVSQNSPNTIITTHNFGAWVFEYKRIDLWQPHKFDAKYPS